MKKLLLTGLLIALAAAGVGYYLWNKPVESVAGKKADSVLTAAELLSAFEQNEEEANARYLGKVIAVKGTIQEIIPGEGLQMQVILDAGNPMSRVSCVMEETHEKFVGRGLKKGDPVTLKGICTGFTMDVVVDRCVVVDGQ